MDLLHEQPDVTTRRPVPRRWAVVEDPDAVRVVAWGTFGAAEAAALEERLATAGRQVAPLVVDLTGVTHLEPAGVTWLGERHDRDGHALPMLVVVVADGRVHRRLTEPGAPQLRLRLS